MRFHALAAAVLALSAAGLAQAQSEYTANFQLDGTLPRLYTGTGVDGPDSLAGRWTSPNVIHTEVVTQDYEGGQWKSENRSEDLHKAGGPPLLLGQSKAFVPEVLGDTHGGAFVALTSLSSRVELEGNSGKGTASASWSRNFELDPFSSVTFGGIASLGILGNASPLNSSTVFNLDSAASFASLTMSDAANRVSTHIGALLTGFAGTDFSSFFKYSTGADGLLSLTVTNNRDQVLRGTLEAGTSVNVMSAPVPEPATWLSMALGLGLVGSIARRAARRRDTAVASA